MNGVAGNLDAFRARLRSVNSGLPQGAVTAVHVVEATPGVADRSEPPHLDSGPKLQLGEHLGRMLGSGAQPGRVAEEWSLWRSP